MEWGEGANHQVDRLSGVWANSGGELVSQFTRKDVPVMSFALNVERWVELR